jgi:predicted glutamine amidotransferase
MCIIAIKPAGIVPPSTELIENMWYSNSDGAGICYPLRGRVVIDKGYLKLKKFKSMLETLEKKIDIVRVPVIYHFRIGTSGGNTAANTHPFPISDKLPLLQKTRGRYPLVMAHNGVIDIKPRKKDISDTMEYIMTQIAPLRQLRKDFYKTAAGKKLLYNATGGKLAFMDGAGNIETVGDFITDGGMIYSNSSYKRDYYYSYYGAWSDYSSDYTSFKNYKKAWDVELLQWLTDDDGYIILTDGKIDEADGYLMDRDGNIYEYDYFIDMAIPVEAAAFTHAGTFLQFNEDAAEPVDILI